MRVYVTKGRAGGPRYHIQEAVGSPLTESQHPELFDPLLLILFGSFVPVVKMFQ